LSCRQLWMLRQIGHGITRADPQLAEMITIFTWLTSGEQMPAHERLRTPLSQAWNGLLWAGCRIGTLATRTLYTLGTGLRSAAAACAAADRWLAGHLPDAAPGMTAAGLWSGVQPERPERPHR